MRVADGINLIAEVDCTPQEGRKPGVRIRIRVRVRARVRVMVLGG
jgi:hypothetical protein